MENQEKIKNSCITVDMGSTGTRVLTFNKKDLNSELYLVPSTYGLVEGSISHISSKSEKLEDNMEIIIKDSTLQKEGKLFDTVHLVKGSLLKTLKLPEQLIASGIGKRTQEEFYVSIITGIGLSVVENFSSQIEGGMVYNVDLTLSIRPEDTKTQKRIDLIKTTLAGIYNFVMPRIGVEFFIKIDVNSIYIEDESQANIRFYAGVEKESLDNKRIIVCDIGGSSTDLALLEDNVLIKSFSDSLSISGETIRTNFMQEVLKVFDRDINYAMAEEAITTGLLQDGDNYVDVRDLITSARKNFCKELINSLLEVLSKNKMKPEEINKLVLVGRPTKTLEGTASVTNITKAYYKKLSSNTDVKTISKEYPIVYGLMYYRISL